MTKVLAEVTGSISFSQRGDKGQKGALMREHDGFESGSYKYLSGAGEEAYVDVVCVRGKWYQCTKTYDNATSSPSLTDGHWTEMSNYKSIATHLLLAENATIKMLGSNQINLYNPSGGAMFGSFRVVSKDNDYALWLGASDGASAPFSVKRSGFAKMTDADITGKITATSGTFDNVTISSGKIAGFTISGNGLTNDSNFNNDAYIILRNDNAGAFAGIGGNLLPASSGLRAVARFENENKSRWFEYDNLGQNIVMLLSAKNADRNVALEILGGCIKGFALNTKIITTKTYTISRDENVVSYISDSSESGDWVEFTLPDMQWYDEGHFVMLSREAVGDYSFKVKPGYCYDKSGKRYETYIYNKGKRYTRSGFDTDFFSAYGSCILVYCPRWQVVSKNAVLNKGIWLAYGVM